MSRMCGKGWVVKGYSAFSGDSAGLEGLVGDGSIRYNGRSKQGK